MIILGVDYGSARTGLALCDKNETLAMPFRTVEERSPKRLVREVARWAQEAGAERIVVGHALNMDGSAGSQAMSCRNFALQLREAAGLPVVLWDERQTSIAAGYCLTDAMVFGEKRKRLIDQVAAALILESYLRWRSLHPGETEPNGVLENRSGEEEPHGTL